jgi:hypothetical protein
MSSGQPERKLRVARSFHVFLRYCGATRPNGGHPHTHQ